MSGNKSVFVSDLSVGLGVEEVFVLSSVSLKPYSGGKFLTCRLADRTGKINGVLWSPPEDAEAVFRPGSLIRLQGKVGRYQGELQVTIQAMSPLEDLTPFDPADFLPASPVDIEAVTAEIREMAGDLRDPFLESLWERFFEDQETFERFRRSPAGKMWHHAYLGGLLEHSRNVIRICRFLSDLYPDLQRGLMMTGALFHDFGKVMELSAGFSLGYTDQGRLIGHVFLGAEKARQYIREIPDFPEELANLVTHLIVSHHGDEDGAIKPPMTREAALLHFADNIDAQYNAFSREFSKIEDPQSAWTNYVTLIERHLYRGTSETNKQNIPPAC